MQLNYAGAKLSEVRIFTHFLSISLEHAKEISLFNKNEKQMQTKRKMRTINIFIEEAFYELKEPKCEGKNAFKTRKKTCT